MVCVCVCMSVGRYVCARESLSFTVFSSLLCIRLCAPVWRNSTQKNILLLYPEAFFLFFFFRSFSFLTAHNLVLK